MYIYITQGAPSAAAEDADEIVAHSVHLLYKVSTAYP